MGYLLGVILIEISLKDLDQVVEVEVQIIIKQNYKDRNPPWIKLHRDLLRDYEFSCLQDASKLLLIEIWLLASQKNNRIPADPKWLKQQLPYKGVVNLKPLIDGGFFVKFMTL